MNNKLASNYELILKLQRCTLPCYILGGGFCLDYCSYETNA